LPQAICGSTCRARSRTSNEATRRAIFQPRSFQAKGTVKA
jgi:hypothetical protein